MERNKEMVIRVPEELLPDFRLFIVVHGGAIIEERSVEDEQKTAEQ
jgi:hypothetical protein